MRPEILVVDDEEDIRFALNKMLDNEGFSVTTAEDYDTASSALRENIYDVVLLDIILGKKTGIDLLSDIRKMELKCQVILVTGAPSIDTAAEAVRLGAYDYIRKPVRKETLLRILNKAIKYKALKDENLKYQQNIEAIFKSVKDAIITVDKNLNIIEHNNAAKTICGYKENGIKGKNINDLMGECSAKCLSTINLTLSDMQPVEVERIECNRLSRPLQVVSLSTSPLIDQEGSFSGAIIVVKDETRIADLEQSLKERQMFHNIIGKNKKMQEIYSMINTLADVDSTVLITGESGTGKELVADALHYKGIRGVKPIIKVNCAALSENLLESELFGHMKGSFTGAVTDKPGKFELADGGTIFLDEIGDISSSVQVKLLRVLESKDIERVGGVSKIKVAVRIVAATNKDLSYMVGKGEFREDLYYRLSVVEILLPPLRDRIDDIPVLTDHFIPRLNNRFNKNVKSVSSKVMKIFLTHHWPGNVRELKHVLESAIVLSQSDIITEDDLPPKFMQSLIETSIDFDGSNERLAIIQALNRTDWKKAKAARLLNISRTSLYQKIEKYNIKKQ